ncbi:MAG: hypothetical protein EP343_25220 [Deltaproteobacteria bacterium]|nr:MAG: hypothetical protein EP343_25220 [Deltaproteobacteria bacterium]
MTLRNYLETLDYAQLCRTCASNSGLPQEAIHDALSEVILKMLSQEQRFAESFQSMGALCNYLQLSAVRRAFRQNKRSLRKEPLHQHNLHTTKPSPEEQIIDQHEEEHRTSLLQKLPKSLSLHRKHKNHLQALLKVLLKKPELLLVRQSGKHRGDVTFHISGLSQELGWSRMTVYNRIQLLKDTALQTSR